MLGLMERASLRPVPHRPAGPVEPAEAVAHLAATLPDLDDAAREAVALVDLVGRRREDLCAERGIAEEDLAAALARARKALRRAAFPLPGSGWCERAERLLSDELDGALAEPGPRRLAVHLANCERCVEHERRLWQVRDGLVASFEDARRPLTPAAVPEPEPPVADGPDAEPAELPDRAQPEPELTLVEVPAPATPEPADPAPAEPPPAEPEPAEPEPAPQPTEPEPGELEPVAAALPEPRFSLAGAAWTLLLALAVLLAVATIAVSAYGIAGGSL